MRSCDTRRGSVVLVLLAVAALAAGSAGPARAQVGADPVWTRLIDGADASHREGRYEESLQLGRQAEARARAISRVSGEPLAISLLSQAQNLGQLRRHDEQRVALEEALRVSQAAFGNRSSQVALVLNNLSEMQFSQGQLGLASRSLQESINISAALGNREAIAIGQGNMAWLQINLRDYPRADAAVRQAIQILESMHKTRELAHQYRTLANVRESMGDLGTAEQAIRKAVTLDDAQDAGVNLAAAADRCQLAGLVSKQRRPDEALALYDQCLRLRERLVPPSDPRYGIIAETMEGIAGIYGASGAHDKAIGLYQRAAEIRSRMFGADSLEGGLAQVRLASAYWEKGDTQQALKTALLASELLRKHNATERNKLGAMRLLGEILMHTNMREYRLKGKEIYQHLAEGERKAGAWPEYGVSLQLLGAACVKVDDQTCAYESMRAALANQQRLYREPSLKAAYAHMGYGSALSWFHDYPQAAQEFGAAFEQWRHLGGNSAESPFSNTDTNVYIDALWQTRSADPALRNAEAVVSFRVSQLSHHSDAARALSQLAARIAAGGGDVATVVRREQDLSRQREKLQGEYAEVLAAVGDADRSAKTDNLRRQISEVEAARDSARQTLSARVPAYRALTTSSVLEPGAIQALLRPGELLLVFNFGPLGGFVWGISPKSLTWSKIDLTESQLATEVQALRRGLDGSTRLAERGLVIKKSTAAGAVDLPVFDRARAHGLYRSLLGSLKDELATAKHLLFVPAGALESLPPSVLVSEPPPAAAAPSPDAYRKTAWLIRDKAITIVPSVFTLQSWQRMRGDARRSTRPFLGIGDPAVERFAGMARCTNAAGPEATALSSLPALPTTGGELGSIARSLGAGDQDLLLGENASEEALGRIDLGAYRVLAFATHGLVAGEVPGLKEPALVLTPPAVCAPDGGLLTASKVAQLRLDADWVVLSACNTASGDGSAAAQGLSGLARAFFYAGARAVLVSHWVVADAAAAALTTRTLAELAKDPSLRRAQALQRAMLALMNDDTHPQSGHPMFWAPFVLVGGE